MKCEKCGNEISIDAYRCPECGEPTLKYKNYVEKKTKPKDYKKIGIVSGLVICCLIVLSVVFINYFSNATKVLKEQRDTATSILMNATEEKEKIDTEIANLNAESNNLKNELSSLNKECDNEKAKLYSNISSLSDIFITASSLNDMNLNNATGGYSLTYYKVCLERANQYSSVASKAKNIGLKYNNYVKDKTTFNYSNSANTSWGALVTAINQDEPEQLSNKVNNIEKEANGHLSQISLLNKKISQKNAAIKKIDDKNQEKNNELNNKKRDIEAQISYNNQIISTCNKKLSSLPYSIFANKA